MAYVRNDVYHAVTSKFNENFVLWRTRATFFKCEFILLYAETCYSKPFAPIVVPNQFTETVKLDEHRTGNMF